MKKGKGDAIQDLLGGEPEPLAARLGIAVTEVAPGHVASTLPLSGTRRRHGAAFCVLAETLGSIAAALHAGPGRVGVPVDLNATYHRTARGRRVAGICTPLHEGGTTATYEIVLTDEEGQCVCTARLACALRDRLPEDSAGRRE